MAYTKYSLTPANNTAAPPDGAPEGMLPSAVNDTMRDMMAQIRDCGDGVRDGTYTMTAPKITGGTITGVTLTGNTLTNPVITGATLTTSAFNGTVGATTASTGAFTTLTSNGATTFTAGTASTSTTTGTTVITGGLGVSGRINAANFDGIVGANTAAAGNFTTLGATGNTSLDGGTFVFNDSGADKDFRIEGDTDANLFFTDASADRIGIGTSSPNAKLQVTSSAFPVLKVADAVGGGALALGDEGTNNNYVGVWRGTANSISGGGFLNVQGNGIAFMSSDNVFGSGTERMRITSTGTVYLASGGSFGVGVTSPAGAIGIGVSPMTSQLILGQNTSATNYGAISFNGVNTDAGRVGFTGGGGDTALYYDVPAGIHTFRITGSTKMILNASGSLLVGTTVENPGIGNTDTGVKAGGDLIAASRASNFAAFFNRNTDDGGVVWFGRQGTQVGSISVTTSATAFNTSSDQRLKNNVVDAPSGNIDDIKVRSFDWIADGSHQEYGMVAQELIEVAPYAVTKPENLNDMMQVDYSKLVPMMIKEIQDLKAEVNQLKAKIGV